MEANYFFWRRRRRRRSSPPCSAVNCLVDSWTSWSSCSHQCGTSGTRERTRQQTRVASCGGTCPYELRQTEACNRDSCQNGGTPHSSGCSCRTGYGGGLLRARWVHFTQAYYIFLCETAVLSEGGGLMKSDHESRRLRLIRLILLPLEYLREISDKLLFFKFRNSLTSTGIRKFLRTNTIRMIAESHISLGLPSWGTLCYASSN